MRETFAHHLGALLCLGENERALQNRMDKIVKNAVSAFGDDPFCNPSSPVKNGIFSFSSLPQPVWKQGHAVGTPAGRVAQRADLAIAGIVGRAYVLPNVTRVGSCHRHALARHDILISRLRTCLHRTSEGHGCAQAGMRISSSSHPTMFGNSASGISDTRQSVAIDANWKSAIVSRPQATYLRPAR